MQCVPLLLPPSLKKKGAYLDEPLHRYKAGWLNVYGNRRAAAKPTVGGMTQSTPSSGAGPLPKAVRARLTVRLRTSRRS
jgi:hypothetical protein